MLQDTELWSVLEVSRYTGAHFPPIALPHGIKRLCGGALGLLGCTILLTDRFTASTPGSRPTLARWMAASRHGYRKQVSPQPYSYISFALLRPFRAPCLAQHHPL